MNSSDITITNDGGKLVVITPYHPTFSPQAQAIGGYWDLVTRTWWFDPRDEQSVRELCIGLYGTDGSAPVQTVTARLNLERWTHIRTDSIWFAGRRIAHRPSRDKAVRLGKGVILVSGGFPASGGSVRHPDLDPAEGTVLEIRDIPAGHDDLTRELAGDGNVSIVDIATDLDALHAERERLTARLAEIDALIGAAE